LLGIPAAATATKITATTTNNTQQQQLDPIHGSLPYFQVKQQPSRIY
jgi:hypothetical protein